MGTIGRILFKCGWKILRYPNVHTGDIGQIFIGNFCQLSQYFTAPTATGARPEAFAQLARSRDSGPAFEIDQFPKADMKAHAHFVIRLHNYNSSYKVWD